ncbi:MAG: hypothetical protein QXO80_04780, partial [Thermosphaera sp.]
FNNRAPASSATRAETMPTISTGNLWGCWRGGRVVSGGGVVTVVVVVVGGCVVVSLSSRVVVSVVSVTGGAGHS